MALILSNKVLHLITIIIYPICRKRKAIRIKPMMISTKKFFLDIITYVIY